MNKNILGLRNSISWFHKASSDLGLDVNSITNEWKYMYELGDMFVAPSTDYLDILFIPVASKDDADRINNNTELFVKQYLDEPFVFENGFSLDGRNLNKFLNEAEDKERELSFICDAVNAGMLCPKITRQGRICLVENKEFHG